MARVWIFYYFPTRGDEKFWIITLNIDADAGLCKIVVVNSTTPEKVEYSIANSMLEGDLVVAVCRPDGQLPGLVVWNWVSDERGVIELPNEVRPQARNIAFSMLSLHCSYVVTISGCMVHIFTSLADTAEIEVHYQYSSLSGVWPIYDPTRSPNCSIQPHSPTSILDLGSLQHRDFC